MIPILYDAGETNFDNNGIGFLTDAISCEVTEERNGIFELSMTYPVSGQHYKEIQVNKIIKAKPNDTSEHQAFRIYKISKPINQIVTIDAEHVSYQLGGVPVKSFRASGNAAAALETLLNAGVVDHPFSSWSDISTSASTELSEPGSIRAALGGQSGSILDVWGGEYEFDNFEVKLYSQRGQDTDVLIEYGKNLTDLTQEQNISETYTGIMPYVKKTNGDSEEHVFLPEVYILSDNYESFPFLKISPVDLSADFENEEEINIDKLREKARAYIKNNGVGIPSVNISLSFVPLWQSPEYAKYQLLERVNLCDRLTVRFAALGVDATAKVIKTVYDTLKEKYISIELGDAKSSFADTVSKIQQQIINSEKNTESMMQAAISNATNLITGAKGGYVYFKRNADGQPEEIMIMNKPDISTATKVWRWNINGLGYSKNGINGPYGLAMTMDGAIVADYITTGTLNAGLIKTGRIQSVNGSTYFDLDSGEITSTKIFSPGIPNIYGVIGKNAISGWEGFYLYDSNMTSHPYFGVLSNRTNLSTSIEGYGDIYLMPGYNGQRWTAAIRLSNNSNGNTTTTIMGDLDTLGSKNRRVKTEHYGDLLLSAYETASPMFGDIGEGKTDSSGVCQVKIDPVFSETVTTQAGYQVFLQGHHKGNFWVSERAEDYFVVQGPTNASFVWELKAKQKGFENRRLRREETD